MQEEFLFSGFGGQGVMFVGQLLAYAAMEEGLEVTWIPSYGPEMRGGTAHCTVVISNKPIGSPILRYPKTAVVFNNPSFEKYDPLVTPDGLLAYNTSLIKQQSTRTDIKKLAIPASTLAEELGNPRLLNMVMLGAVLSVMELFPISAVKNALDLHIPEHRRNMLALNYQALEKGAEFAANNSATV